MKRKDLIEWGIMLTVVAVLYLTGWYRPVMGFLQRGVLATGLFRPDVELKETFPADYSFTFQDAHGQLRSLAEFKGETILINIWATWCPPCRAELPDMEDLYRTEEGQSIRWIMLSVDKDLEKATDFFTDREYPWEAYQLNGQLPASFQYQVVPTTFVISPAGEVVVKREGMAQYNTRSFRQFIRSLTKT
ncbi:MAG TPA: thioredoxin [Cytophagales bacterium]|nr:thioredoxin [Cytophagales bacterium]HAA17959.1 thioredoxin [Cytophagales bacterium]HAP64835.1 thioredoxin [Cytophagales bacterium]